MAKSNTVRAKHTDFVMIDLLSVELALLCAILIRWEYVCDRLEYYRNVAVAIGAIYLLLMMFNSFHKSILRRGYLKEAWQVLIVNVEITFATIALLFVIKTSEGFSRMVFGLFFIFANVIMYLARIARKENLKTRFREGKDTAKSVIVAHVDTAEKFVDTLRRKNSGYYEYIGIVLLETKGKNKVYKEIPVIRKQDILQFVKDNAVSDAFILARPGESGGLSDTFLNMGITVHIGLNLEMAHLPNPMMDNVGSYSVITSTITKGTAGEQIIKRIFDILISIIGLIFTAVFTLIFGPVIKIQSKGPVFFAQERVGKNGKTFKMYKFRTMEVDAEEKKQELMDKNEMKGLMFKVTDDPRIFPIGKFLRRTSIDECPQFWNILKGDMSLVGTRPPTVDEFRKYDMHHLSRLAIKPGLTGLWQISGRSDITDFEEIVKLDTEYIRNFSLNFDIKIIAKTFAVVLGMKGSK